MAYAGGAFKTNSLYVIRAVKESDQPPGAGCPPGNRTDQNSCKKFSQNAAFA